MSYFFLDLSLAIPTILSFLHIRVDPCGFAQFRVILCDFMLFHVVVTFKNLVFSILTILYQIASGVKCEFIITIFIPPLISKPVYIFAGCWFSNSRDYGKSQCCVLVIQVLQLLPSYDEDYYFAHSANSINTEAKIKYKIWYSYFMRPGQSQLLESSLQIWLQ